MRLVERVYGDIWGLQDVISKLICEEKGTHRACKIPAYSQGTRPSSLLGGRTSIRHQQSNIRTWRTTNTPASV